MKFFIWRRPCAETALKFLGQLSFITESTPYLAVANVVGAYRSSFVWYTLPLELVQSVVQNFGKMVYCHMSEWLISDHYSWPIGCGTEMSAVSQENLFSLTSKHLIKPGADRTPSNLLMSLWAAIAMFPMPDIWSSGWKCVLIERLFRDLGKLMLYSVLCVQQCTLVFITGDNDLCNWELWSVSFLQPLSEVVQHVEKGYRMEAPDNCPPEIYQLMRACWHIDPSQRPTFMSLHNDLDRMARMT